MKQLLIWLLNKYTRTEIGRIEILRILNEQVSNEYNEQTSFGNVYNYFEEFIIANRFMNQCIKESDYKSLEIIRNGLVVTFDKTTQYLTKEGTK